MVKFFTMNSIKQQKNGNGFKFEPTNGDCIGRGVTTRAGGRMDDNFIKEPKCEVVCNLDRSHEASSRIYGTDGLSRTVDTMTGGWREPITVDTDIKQCVRKNYEREKEQIAQSDKEIYQCECESGFQDNKVGIKDSPTLRAGNSHTAVYNNYRIRKLTPLECFRLMGFDDEDFYKAKAAGISDSQLYKIAGNSIVVQVLEHIFEMILKEDL